MMSLLRPFTDLGIFHDQIREPSEQVRDVGISVLYDIEGHKDDENVQAALKLLDERASFVKVAGSYPTAVL